MRAQGCLPGDAAALHAPDRPLGPGRERGRAGRHPLPGRHRAGRRTAGGQHSGQRVRPGPSPGLSPGHPGEFLGLRFGPGRPHRLPGHPDLGLAGGLSHRGAAGLLCLHPAPGHPGVAALPAEPGAGGRGRGGGPGHRAGDGRRSAGRPDTSRARRATASPAGDPGGALRPGAGPADADALDPLVRYGLLVLRHLYLAPQPAGGQGLRPEPGLPAQPGHLGPSRSPATSAPPTWSSAGGARARS